MTADPPTPSALALYARIVPVLALLQIGWLVGSDHVLRRSVDKRKAETHVTWGFRSVRSGLREDDEEVLTRTYLQAADRIQAYYDGIEDNGIEDTGAVADLVAKAKRTQDAYLWLHLRGWLSLGILLIGVLFFGAAAFLKGFGIAERAAAQLVGCVCVLAGLVWFRWCFASVSEDLAYAGDGGYGFAAPADLTFLVVIAAAAFSIAALVIERRRAAGPAATSEA